MTKAEKVHPIAKIWIGARNSVKNDYFQKILEDYKLKALYDQNPSEQIPTCQEILNLMNSSLVKPPNSSWEIRYDFKGIKGATTINLHNKFDINKPSVIHHHGIGEIKQLSLRFIANENFFNRFNVFSIKASHHNSVNDVIRNCTNTFTNLACCLCSSILAIDETISFHKNNSTTPVIVEGFSLGGMATALHYYLFDTADYYFPIISYPNLGEIILDKKNEKLVYNYNKIKNNSSIKNCFSIPDNLKNKPKNKIFPILSKYDELIDYKKAKIFWKGYKPKVFDTGHASILLKINEVRKYMLGKIEG